MQKTEYSQHTSLINTLRLSDLRRSPDVYPSLINLKALAPLPNVLRQPLHAPLTRLGGVVVLHPCFRAFEGRDGGQRDPVVVIFGVEGPHESV
jgi:hypothetical protein